MVEPSDGELVGRAHRGSRDAAAMLFERHWGGAWRLARTVSGPRDMADDIVQDAFERAFAALGRFDQSRPFAPWLHRIVINRALDLLRSERRLVGLDVAAHPSAEWRDVSADDRALLEAVATLTPQRRVVTVLRYGSATRRPRSRGCWSCRRARSTCCSCCCRHGRWRGRLPCPGSDRHGGGVFR
jgi:RNA polymerase sigma-70 factor (ECF subfamily)